MSRLRLNQELRNKIASRWRVHAEQEETDERENTFKQEKVSNQNRIRRGI